MRKRRIFLSILLIIVLLCPMYAAFADATESTVLTVACEEHEVELFDAAVMRFCEQHPGVEVRFEIMTTEQMDDALENGTNVDVFLTASNFTNLDRLVHRGLIAPLASETLLANMAKMYAPFRDYVTYQQQVYAYPREVLANTRTVNTELLRMYGSFLGEVPTTMSEYIEQMRKWYDTSITVGSDSSFTEQNMPETLLEYTLDELVIAYLCEYYQTDDTRGTYRDFSTSDFANMLDSLDFLRVAAFQMTEAEEKPWNAAAWGEKSGSLYTKVGFTPVVIGFEENEQYILPPAFDAEGEQCIITYLQLLVIRADSEKQALANAFIEAVAESDIGDKSNFELFEDTDGLVNPGVTEEELQAYREMLPHFDLHTGAIISGMFWGEESATDVLMAYFHQNLTKEEALSKLDAMQSQWIQQQPMGVH